MDLDLESLKDKAHAARSRTVAGGGLSLYYNVYLPGDVLLELCERAERLQQIEDDASAIAENMGAP